ncbi:MAG TPA: hypothetical protein VFK02_25925 [Kofleriaceae bacterium]|nr:hypothetical protein [Kofleriaceae bacterium]
MTPQDHAAFTERLHARLAADPDVMGLVMAGSSSGLAPPPDAFSDHDFWIVTRPGAQERFRTDPSWLPDAGELVLHYRETAHGIKALYRSGHLLEFAVFDLDEAGGALINRYRIVFDRADLTARLERARANTAAAASKPADLAFRVGQFLTALVVGAGRAVRGETLSGHHFVRVGAIEHLLVLHRARRGDDPHRDSLDPARRFERAYPELGQELELTMRRPIPEAARQLLAIGARELGDLLPPTAVSAVSAFLARLAP